MNMLNSRDATMHNAGHRRFVKVAAPSIHAGIGNALREAFAPIDGEMQRTFDRLLAQLD